MKTSPLITGFLIVLLAVCCLPTSAIAQQNDDTPSSPLAIQQEGLSGKMANLQKKLLRLVQQIREDNPAQADALLAALKKAKQQKVKKRMEDISRLLDEVNYDQAASQQEQVIQDVLTIIQTLTERDNYYKRLQKRIEQLEKWRKEINKLSRREWKQKRESDKLTDLQKAKQKVGQNIDKVRDLLKKQKGILQKTQESRQTGQQNFEKIADSQEKVRKETKNLSESMSEDKLPQTSPDARPSEPGQKQIEKATGHQKQSQQELNRGKGTSATKKQKQSIQSLEKALSQLQKEKKRLESMSPKKQMKRMADKQGQISKQTKSLKKNMNDSDMKSTRQSLNSAQSKMSKASNKLSQKQPQSASSQQKGAHEDLQKAREKIDKKLSELRKQQRDALLSKLIDMFKAMLEKQKSISQTTEDLQRTREKGEWERSESIQCSEMADGELALRDKSQAALKLLTENGSPVVFPQVVRGLSKDLTSAHELLQDENTREPTQTLQTSIEETLEDFIAALKMAQDNPPPEKKKPKKGQSGKKKKPPLINVLAELKLLKNMQKRVNSRTQTLSQKKEDSQSRVEQITPLSRRQNSILRMTRDLRQKLEGTSDSPPSSQESSQ